MPKLLLTFAIAGILAGTAACAGTSPSAQVAQPESSVAPSQTMRTTPTAGAPTLGTAAGNSPSPSASAPTLSASLEARTGVRGETVLVPESWEMTGEDGGGSGSTSTWVDPGDPERWIRLEDGMSIGGWWETDGVSGSINPEGMLPDGAKISRLDRTTFRYSYPSDQTPDGLKSTAPVQGVWIAFVSTKGQADGYRDLQISAGGDKPLPDQVINDFIDRAQAIDQDGSSVAAKPTKKPSRQTTDSPRLVTTVDLAYNYICTLDAEELPRLTTSHSDAYATSALQMFLSQVFFMPVIVDGQYGPKTREVVRQYQRNTGLEADGLVGPITWSVLKTACECEGPSC